MNLVVACLNSGGNNGGFRTEPGEHLIVAPLRGNHYGDHVAAESHLVMHCLRSEGADASEEGTGRGVPLVLAFDPTQMTSPGNYSNPKPGDPCHPLAATGHPPTICFDWQAGHGNDRSFRGKGRQYIMRKGAYTGALGATKRDAIAQTLTSSYAKNVVVHKMSVRRLIPVECERLQVFPDGWTEGESDSARYRMLGNAVVEVCAYWIGNRIVEVDVVASHEP